MNEIVFIDQDIDKEKKIADFEKCLLKESEQNQFENKIKFEDPFPKEI